MNAVDLFINILQSVGRVLSRGGVSDKLVQQLAGVTQYAGDLVKRGETAITELKYLDHQVWILITENRVPTDAEWEKLDTDLRAVDERFARLKEKLGG